MTTGFSSPASSRQTTYHQDLFEYELLADVAAEAYEKVMAEKKAFYGEYRYERAIKVEPQITIASFFAREVMENTIIRWMENILNNRQSFPVTLNNFSGFPPHTIYLRVQNPAPFQQLAKELNVINTYVSSCSCPPIKVISHPHINIAANLPEEIYSKALTHYSHRSFHESFMVNELRLVKRKHEYEPYKIINVFGLHSCDNELFGNS